MTRKDYVALARALSLTKPKHDDGKRPAGHGHLHGARSQWEHDLTVVCNALEADNPRFDRTRFLEAAGYFNTWQEDRTAVREV